MRCSICGRKLKNPQSRELGYGPICYKRKFGIVPHADHGNTRSSISKIYDDGLPGQISMESYLQMLLKQ